MRPEQLSISTATEKHPVQAADNQTAPGAGLGRGVNKARGVTVPDAQQGRRPERRGRPARPSHRPDTGARAWGQPVDQPGSPGTAQPWTQVRARLPPQGGLGWEGGDRDLERGCLGPAANTSTSPCEGPPSTCHSPVPGVTPASLMHKQAKEGNTRQEARSSVHIFLSPRVPAVHGLLPRRSPRGGSLHGGPGLPVPPAVTLPFPE